jgi:hypothetical protein
MAGLVQRTAEGITSFWDSVWTQSSGWQKVLIAIALIVTGLAIPVIPIVWIARAIAR